ncbi:hypothetical protein RFI_05398 [Reticulomyxa filosa]|uniref:Uncharacterized protein n=1 Tax=Reticulomyxa filosa TaxID=46433 RepID=X6P0W1_RETFI|nr:hypothetical protein RFI_05398 [Reticulomyxa filosa]|eukprot:ETO31719.1 hypothetical protein RFI_05398 [Reticulomyxa filosa]
MVKEDWVDFVWHMRRNRQVVTYDLRGYGQTGLPSGQSTQSMFSTHLLASDVASLIEMLFFDRRTNTQQKVFVMGVGLGGLVAQVLAIRFGCRLLQGIIISGVCITTNHNNNNNNNNNNNSNDGSSICRGLIGQSPYYHWHCERQNKAMSSPLSSPWTMEKTINNGQSVPTGYDPQFHYLRRCVEWCDRPAIRLFPENDNNNDNDDDDDNDELLRQQNTYPTYMVEVYTFGDGEDGSDDNTPQWVKGYDVDYPFVFQATSCLSRMYNRPVQGLNALMTGFLRDIKEGVYHIQDLDVPLLAIYGEHDQLTPLDRVQELIKTVGSIEKDFHIIEGAGSLWWLTHCKEGANAVDSFLNQLEQNQIRLYEINIESLEPTYSNNGGLQSDDRLVLKIASDAFVTDSGNNHFCGQHTLPFAVHQAFDQPVTLTFEVLHPLLGETNIEFTVVKISSDNKSEEAYAPQSQVQGQAIATGIVCTTQHSNQLVNVDLMAVDFDHGQVQENNTFGSLKIRHGVVSDFSNSKSRPSQIEVL